MMLLPMHVSKVEEISKHWSTSHSPPMKVFSERPDMLQVFNAPMALFIDVPEGAILQDFKFKESVCNAFWGAGVEIPLPTSHPSVNTYNGMVLARRNVKVHWKASCASDLAFQHKDPDCLYVFGIENGKCQIELDGEM